jgi:hypothetical protein
MNHVKWKDLKMWITVCYSTYDMLKLSTLHIVSFID